MGAFYQRVINRSIPASAGEPLLQSGHKAVMRSIPASAGEPRQGKSCQGRAEVYPRECGGTGATTWIGMDDGGLSPRVRGNRRRACPLDAHGRSIPASAGEPMWASFSVASPPVYPRECGGTNTPALYPIQRGGLSPRVRGNHERREAAIPTIGSIPASAGEPRISGQRNMLGTVYPRECGGTLGGVTLCRVRLRSIPASAGEPTATPPFWNPREVYPRECGGTSYPAGSICQGRGLSPRVRGNRHSGLPFLVFYRSIPASAGEPRCLCHIPISGSIPASAGEPLGGEY